MSDSDSENERPNRGNNEGIGIVGAVGAAALVGFGIYALARGTNSTPETIIVNNANECEKLVHKLKSQCSDQNVLGFDVEGRAPVALIQLSSCQGLTVLFRISKIGAIPECLKDLLQNENILKVGVAPIDDAELLQVGNHYGWVEVRGTLDLRFPAVLAGYKQGSLEKLYSLICGKELRKNCSFDWEVNEFTPKQRNYAADDVIAAVEIYMALIKKIGKKQIMKYCDKRFDPFRHCSIQPTNEAADKECSIQ